MRPRSKRWWYHAVKRLLDISPNLRVPILSTLPPPPPLRLSPSYIPYGSCSDGDLNAEDDINTRCCAGLRMHFERLTLDFGTDVFIQCTKQSHIDLTSFGGWMGQGHVFVSFLLVCTPSTDANQCGYNFAPISVVNRPRSEAALENVTDGLIVNGQRKKIEYLLLNLYCPLFTKHNAGDGG